VVVLLTSFLVPVGSGRRKCEGTKSVVILVRGAPQVITIRRRFYIKGNLRLPTEDLILKKYKIMFVQFIPK
jgi:hypothetical protein